MVCFPPIPTLIPSGRFTFALPMSTEDQGSTKVIDYLPFGPSSADVPQTKREVVTSSWTWTDLIYRKV